MRNRFVWAGALALAIGATSQVETKAAYTNFNGTVITNGVIIITTRAANDGHFFSQSSSTIDDMDDPRGPGYSPGDSAMGELLGDFGYSVHMIPDKALNTVAQGGGTCLDVLGNPNNPFLYYNGQHGPADIQSADNELLSPMLVVVSGSGSSADVAPPNTNGIPIVCGEHAVLGDTAGAPGSHSEIFLYGNKTDSSNKGVAAGLYMKVLLPNHPIMQGIPLDAQNRVKIWRDPYPEENAHILTPLGAANGGLANYVVSWTCVGLGTAHPATDLQIIGVLDSDNNQAVFATLERGGAFGNDTSDVSSPWSGYAKAPSRLVHFFVCENGSHNTRRSFNALTVWGRILFVRACKWAMEETLQPYQGLGIIDVGQVSPSNIRLGWTGSKDYNYRIYGATSLINPNWVPVVDSITNNGDGVRVTRTLNIASAPQTAFLRVATLPDNYFTP
jgi:hypothetical protein